MGTVLSSISEIFSKEGTPIITSSIAGDSRIFQTGENPISFGGTLWHNDAFVTIMHTKGPLAEPVIVKVCKNFTFVVKIMYLKINVLCLQFVDLDLSLKFTN